MENSGPPHPCQQGRWKLPSAFRGWSLELGAGIRCRCLVTLAAPTLSGHLCQGPHLTTHLPSPCPQPGTSGSDRTGSDSAASCPQGSPCLPGRCTWHFSALYAGGGATRNRLSEHGGGGLGEGTVPILLPMQTKAPSVHSYFPNIWVQGREKWRSRGGREVWDILGENSTSTERSQNPRLY